MSARNKDLDRRKHEAFKRAVKAGNALCAGCGGEATEVDHIRPVSEGGARYDPSNGQMLCSSCHGLKTRAEQRARIMRQRAARIAAKKAAQW